MAKKDGDKKEGFRPFWMKKKEKDGEKKKKGGKSKKGLFGKGKKVEDKDNDGE